MIEQAPSLKTTDLSKAIVEIQRNSQDVRTLINKLNDDYAYWDTIKYKPIPQEYTAKDIWYMIVAFRLMNKIPIWDKYNIHFCLTNRMQQLCHDLDMNFGGSWVSDSLIPEKDRERYLISSLMEEAISSSQMEGASTTRKVAKEMLRKKIMPRDKSQQMILNNYQTIQFIVAHKEEALTVELLLQIHQLMTQDTLENPEDAGRFRQNNDVVVEDGITHEIVHTPPTYSDIPEFVTDLCSFFNGTTNTLFIHPIIKGIIVHFMIAYMHPFVDGNGRTARALFYWYMLKQGYWLTEYLSISKIIYKRKKAYEKSFLYAEVDGNDIGYFITYNIRVLDLAFKDLQNYIRRKTQEKQISTAYLKIPNINERQAQIIKLYHDRPNAMFTVKDLQVRFLVTPTTAKSDIIKLVDMHILEEVPLNKVKRGYIKGERFDDIIKNISL